MTRHGTLRIATRGSRLALVQTALAASALRTIQPELVIETVEISTQGDRDRQTPLSMIGGQGIFVTAVREALLDGRADIAVHSLKDVPTAAVPALAIGAVLERGDPRDCFVGADHQTLAELPAGSRVGTSSTRRAALLRTLRHDIEPVDIRGNVETRIEKVRDGSYDGAILATAGLRRLGRMDDASHIFAAEAFLPSPGQGVVAIECRADDEDVLALLERVDHRETRAAADAERGVLAALGTGCDLPVGAYAQIENGQVALRAFLASSEGGVPVFGQASGGIGEAERIGRKLGEELLRQVRGAVEAES